jgi:hypothetical protein
MLCKTGTRILPQVGQERVTVAVSHELRDPDLFTIDQVYIVAKKVVFGENRSLWT